MELTLEQVTDALAEQGYTVLEKLGQGGFGEVYKIQDSGQEIHSLKLLTIPKQWHPAVADVYGTLARVGIQDKERYVDVFRHPNIMQYYTKGSMTLKDAKTGDERVIPYVVGEFIEGKTYADLGRRGQKEFQQTIVQIVSAVAYIHKRRFVHNDLKIDNVMHDEKRDRPVIIDFSNAEETDEHGIVVEKNPARPSGRYSAPEIDAIPEGGSLEGKITYRSDVWMLGLMLCEMLTGINPKIEKKLNDLHGFFRDYHVPIQYHEIITTALAQTPEHRYKDASRLFHALQEAPFYRQRKRWDAIVEGVVFGLGILFFVGTLYTLSTQFKRDDEEQKQNLLEWREQGKKVDAEKQKPIPSLRDKHPRTKEPDIKAEEDEYTQCIPFEGAKRQACNAFREGEELLDKKNYERAALRLEDAVELDPTMPTYYGALIEAYYRMERYHAASDVLSILENNFPAPILAGYSSDIQKKVKQDIAVFAPEIRAEIDHTGPGFAPVTRKQCDVRFIKNQHPGCRALVAASTVEGDDAIVAYEKIIAQYPDSSLAHKALGKLLLEKGNQQTLPGGVIIYDNIDGMNKGLDHYRTVAELTGARNSMFADIADVFDGYNDKALEFVYRYRAEVNDERIDNTVAALFLDVVEADWRVGTATWINWVGEQETINVSGMKCRRRESDCDKTTAKEMYHSLALLCTVSDFEIKNCPNWQHLPDWRMPSRP